MIGTQGAPTSNVRRGPLDPPPHPLRSAAKSQQAEGVTSPDQKWSIMMHDNNLYLRCAVDGKETQLSQDGKPSDAYTADLVWWSPDSRDVLAMRVEEGETHWGFIPWSRRQPTRCSQNCTSSIISSRVIGSIILGPNCFTLWPTGAGSISKDVCSQSVEHRRCALGRGFVAVHVRLQPARASGAAGVAVDAASGAARAIVDEHSETFIDYSGKFFCRWMRRRNHLDVRARRLESPLALRCQTGRVKNQITKGEWVVQAWIVWITEQRQIWFKPAESCRNRIRTTSHFCRVNFDGSGLTVLTEATARTMATCRRTKYLWTGGRAWISRRSRNCAAATMASWSANWKRPTTVTGDRLACPSRSSPRGATARPIFTASSVSANFDPRKKYPVVEEIYAGPQGSTFPRHFRSTIAAAAIAERGIIVVQMDGMGTAGRSKAFHDVCWKNLQGRRFPRPDRVDHRRRQEASADGLDASRNLRRLGRRAERDGASCWHNDFYKVAVADCGCHDNRMDKIWWNEQWMGWPVGPQYAENSNVVNAHILQGKLLLMVGEMDDNVDPSSAPCRWSTRWKRRTRISIWWSSPARPRLGGDALRVETADGVPGGESGGTRKKSE